MQAERVGPKIVALTANCTTLDEIRPVVEGWPLWRHTRLQGITKGILQDLI